jgi:uncharacterized protein YijF (DUF1287 family)
MISLLANIDHARRNLPGWFSRAAQDLSIVLDA